MSLLAPTAPGAADLFAGQDPGGVVHMWVRIAGATTNRCYGWPGRALTSTADDRIRPSATHRDTGPWGAAIRSRGCGWICAGREYLTAEIRTRRRSCTFG